MMRSVVVSCAMLLAVGTSLASARAEPTEIRVLSRWANHPFPVDARSSDWAALPAQYQAPGLSVAAVNDGSYLYVRLVSSANERTMAPAPKDAAATVLPVELEPPPSDAWLPDEPRSLEPLDLPFEDEFDGQELGSLLDLLGLEEWALAGMSMADWLPEIGMIAPEPQGLLQMNSREGANSIYLLRIPLGGSIRGANENTDGRTGSLVLEFTQKAPGHGAVQDAWWEGAPGPGNRVDGGNSWDAGESGPPVEFQSGSANDGHPTWLRLTVQLAETPTVSPEAR